MYALILMSVSMYLSMTGVLLVKNSEADSSIHFIDGSFPRRYWEK